MLKIKIIVGLLALFSSFMLLATVDVYQLDDKEQENRFHQLIFELRCPKCQNQNIADSNAEIAQDLRAKILQLLKADKSDAQIIDYMLERYGEFVLYKPRVKPQTYLLWYGPYLLLLLGLVVLVFIIRSHKESQDDRSSLSDSEAKTLDALLKIKPEK